MEQINEELLNFNFVLLIRNDNFEIHYLLVKYDQ